MGRVLQEIEVSLHAIAEFLDDTGWDAAPEPDRVVLHTKAGIGFSVRLDSERKFILLATYLPVRKDFEEPLELVNTLNREVFLGCFCIDDDRDLLVSYGVSYERGLILAQFSRIVMRFAGMLEHVVKNFDENDLIFAFGAKDESSSDAPRPSLQ